MPHFPAGAPAHLLSNIPTDDLMKWIENPDSYPANGPRDRHLGVIQYGCTIVQTYDDQNTRSHFTIGK
jgi:hypothetical protein